MPHQRQRIISVLLLIGILALFTGGAAQTRPSGQKKSSAEADAQRKKTTRRAVTLADAVLPYPTGVMHYPAKNTGYMDVAGFVKHVYQKDYQSYERTFLANHGFISAYCRGWMAPDGFESDIWLARFSTSGQARYEYQSVASAFKWEKSPNVAFPDPAVAGEGTMSPEKSKYNKTVTQIAASWGDMFIYVKTYSPGDPDKIATMTLMQQEMQLLIQKSQ
ncbi:hypothetical protein [Streptomyces sp. CA2R106]|uniref:hypothetical protein n=1 Tax=Streptomyces sp. CA2R106 TaxID=3120153 RepID=UPI003008D5AB